MRFTIHEHKTDGNPADCPDEWPDLVLQDGQEVTAEDGTVSIVGRQEGPPGAVVLEMSDAEYEMYKAKHRPAYETWERAHFLAQAKERLLLKVGPSGVMLLATGTSIDDVQARYARLKAAIDAAQSLDELTDIAASM